MSDEQQRIRELVDSFEMLKAQRERIRTVFEAQLRNPLVIRRFNDGRVLTDEEVAALTSSSPQPR